MRFLIARVLGMTLRGLSLVMRVSMSLPIATSVNEARGDVLGEE